MYTTPEVGMDHLTMLDVSPPELVTIAREAGFDPVDLCHRREAARRPGRDVADSHPEHWVRDLHGHRRRGVRRKRALYSNRHDRRDGKQPSAGLPAHRRRPNLLPRHGRNGEATPPRRVIARISGRGRASDSSAHRSGRFAARNRPRPPGLRDERWTWCQRSRRVRERGFPSPIHIYRA